MSARMPGQECTGPFSVAAATLYSDRSLLSHAVVLLTVINSQVRRVFATVNRILLSCVLNKNEHKPEHEHEYYGGSFPGNFLLDSYDDIQREELTFMRP